MFEIKVTITAPGLEQAINNLAGFIQNGSQVQPPQIHAAGVPQVQQPTAATLPIQPSPQPIPAPAPQIPPASVPEKPQPVQTAAPKLGLTLDAIVNASAALVEKGMMNQLIALLGKYGVQAVNQVQPAQYDALANDLRALGAQL